MINLTLHAAAMPANSRSQQKSSSLMQILYIIFLPASCCVTNIMMYLRGIVSRDDFFLKAYIFKKVPTFCTCADSSFNFLFLREKKLSILAFFFEATNLLNASSNPHLERP
jgi:hypothetical protein